MKQNKDIGTLNQTEQPRQVSESQDKHEMPENNLQKYIPQNGGQIQAAEGNFKLTDENDY